MFIHILAYKSKCQHHFQFWHLTELFVSLYALFLYFFLNHDMNIKNTFNFLHLWSKNIIIMLIKSKEEKQFSLLKRIKTNKSINCKPIILSNI